MNNRKLGEIGEDTAEKYLISQGFRILQRNYRCREGEIDILAERDGILKAVEVKTRRNAAFGSPCEAVSRYKQEHIRKAALQYLRSCGRFYPRIEMDVIEIGINHIQNAF